MAYGNTGGFGDPNQHENNQVYTIYEGPLYMGHAVKGFGDQQSFARFFTMDDCSIGYFDWIGEMPPSSIGLTLQGKGIVVDTENRVTQGIFDSGVLSQNV